MPIVLRVVRIAAQEGELLGLDRDGAFADAVVIAAAQLWPIPPGISFECAAYAEPLAAALAILESGITSRDSIAILGRGRIAELTRMVLRDHGFHHVSVHHPTGGPGSFDTVVETGVENLEEAVALLRPGGLLILKSRRPGAVLLPTLDFIRKRITLRAIRYAPFGQAAEYLGRIAGQLESFIGGHWPLEEYEAAFHEASSETTKVFFAVRD